MVAARGFFMGGLPVADEIRRRHPPLDSTEAFR